jgi:acyl-CoA thioesterase I
MAFNRIYPDPAARYDALLYPLFFDGVATRPELNQADGLHPNAAGIAVVVQRITPYVMKLIALSRELIPSG